MKKNDLPQKTEMTYLSFSECDVIPVTDILDTILEAGAKCKTIECTPAGIVFDCKAEESGELKPFQVVFDSQRGYLHIQAVEGIKFGTQVIQELINKIANR